MMCSTVLKGTASRTNIYRGIMLFEECMVLTANERVAIFSSWLPKNAKLQYYSLHHPLPPCRRLLPHGEAGASQGRNRGRPSDCHSHTVCWRCGGIGGWQLPLFGIVLLSAWFNHASGMSVAHSPKKIGLRCVLNISPSLSVCSSVRLGLVRCTLCCRKSLTL